MFNEQPICLFSKDFLDYECVLSVLFSDKLLEFVAFLLFFYPIHRKKYFFIFKLFVSCSSAVIIILYLAKMQAGRTAMEKRLAEGLLCCAPQA